VAAFDTYLNNKVKKDLVVESPRCLNKDITDEVIAELNKRTGQ